MAVFTDEWKTAPKDESVINVQFPNGQTAKARWSRDAGHWEMRKMGKWMPMRDVGGACDPVVWWPDGSDEKR